MRRRRLGKVAEICDIAALTTTFCCSDLSFWCFPCEQYLNGLTNPRLRPILDAVHQQKFGEHLPDGRLELQLAS